MYLHCFEKRKKYYFRSLNEKYINENKCFQKTTKPFLSMNVQASKRTKLAEQDGSLITNKEKFTIKQDDFFSNNVI